VACRLVAKVASNNAKPSQALTKPGLFLLACGTLGAMRFLLDDKMRPMANSPSPGHELNEGSGFLGLPGLFHNRWAAPTMQYHISLHNLLLPLLAALHARGQLLLLGL